MGTLSCKRKSGCRSRRGAYSLLEVVLASALCASALVPALTILRNGMTQAETIDRRNMLLLYGVQKVEEQLAVAAATWSEGTTSGDFSADGHANIRYSVTRSDDSSDGGIPNRLMNIDVTIYYDEDGDDALDAGELRTTFESKTAKMVSYETEAGS